MPRRELRGIKTKNIQQGIYFSEASASETSSPPQTGHSDLLPDNINQSQTNSINELDSPLPTRNLASKRSIDNFSQPRSSYHTAQNSPTSPLPRWSSRHIAPDFFTFHDSPTNVVPESEIPFEEPGPHDCSSPAWNQESYDPFVPHAVTTPDDTALSIRPPPFSLIRTELAGVPEEDEISEGKRNSMTTSIIRPVTPASSLRHAKSFPSIRSSPSRWSDVLPPPLEDGDSVFYDEHRNSSKAPLSGINEQKEEVPFQSSSPGRISLRKEESWEEVIDFCYDHEAEADCNFDWGLASRHAPLTNAHARPMEGSSLDGEGKSNTRKARTSSNASAGHDIVIPKRSSSLYSSSALPSEILQTLPELQPSTVHSVESSFSSIPEANYPLPPQSTPPTNVPTVEDKAWPIVAPTTPLVMAEDTTSDYEDFYARMLASQTTSNNQLLFRTGRVDGSTISNSPRSSRSPISKSNSQESFWHSQAGAVASRHRNTGSIGSLPDLVHSVSNDRSDSVNEQLGDHSSSLSASDALANTTQHQRRPSLAKDVALKSILSKKTTCDAGEVPDMPPPMYMAYRDRANSDTTPFVGSAAIPPPPQPHVTTRMRSPSSTSSLLSRKSNRASYSLFPAPAIR